MFECLGGGENGTTQFWLGRVVVRQAITKTEIASYAAKDLGKD